ncbi:DegT/DnrJ/EryC1/StrS family aminotransferase [Cystobacter fuscus]|uniref:DegT/DnrJ/EryC1/StrS family aminotransferase n=1 Tax=Cystobacter fuscus TaxID=43 RepID=UPI0037BFD3F8
MSGPVKTDGAWVREALERLTGFPHAVFVQSGTAALELVLRLLGRRGWRVALPGLTCWTNPHAVRKVGLRPVFCDVDEYWGLRPPREPVEVVLGVDPWGGAGNWTVGGKERLRIGDATQSPGARVGGALLAERFDAAILSFGVGKPISLGGGGVALFSDERAAVEARRHLQFGFWDGRWALHTDRYVFPQALYPLLAERLRRALVELPRARRALPGERAALTRLLPHLAPPPLRPGTEPGLFSMTPLILQRGAALTPADLEAAAIVSGVPLVRHPVSAPYLEAVWRGPRPDRPLRRVESLSPRLLFFEGRGPKPRRALARFLSLVLGAPERFRRPYSLGEAAPLPEHVRHWAERGTVCRSASGELFVVDRALARAFPVPEAIAAEVQRHEWSPHGR